MFDWLTADTVRLLWQGLLLTLGMTLFTTVCSLVIGIGWGAGRLYSRPVLQKVFIIFIEVHRNIPALVLIIFWAFAIPNLFPLEVRRTIFFNNGLWRFLSDLTGLSLPYYGAAAAFALILNTSGYLAELFRAGVGTISADSIDAARTLGCTRRQTFWRLLLPDGFRAAFPAISTRLIHNMKNTSLVAFVSVPVFFQEIQTAITKTFRAVEFLLLATVVYLILGWLVGMLLRWIEVRIVIGAEKHTLPYQSRFISGHD